MLLLFLFLAGCAPVPVSRRAEAEPAIPPAALPASPTPGTKVVSLVTPTPAPTEAEDLPGPTPTPAGTVFVQRPEKNLADLGYEVAALTDPVGGFTFDYPAEWVVEDLPEDQKWASVIYTIIVHTPVDPSALPPKNLDAAPPGFSAVEFSVYVKDAPTSLEVAVEQRKSQATTMSGQPLPILAEEDWQMGGGLVGHRVLYDLGPNQDTGRNDMVSELVLFSGDKFVLVSGRGDQSLFVLIASTLRPAE